MGTAAAGAGQTRRGLVRAAAGTGLAFGLAGCATQGAPGGEKTALSAAPVTHASTSAR